MFQSNISPLETIRIILGPARRPIMQLLGAIGIAIALPLLLILPFACGPADLDHVRYILAASQLRKLNDALQYYRADCGRYPWVDEGLAVLVDDHETKGWMGPYLDKIPVDPWRRPYLYEPGTDSPTIASYGADGAPGGRLFDADLSNSSWPQPIPKSPYEMRAQLTLLAMWLASVLMFAASVCALVRFSRAH